MTYKPPRRDSAGRVIQDRVGPVVASARGDERRNQAAGMSMRLRRAERDAEAGRVAANDALVEEQRVRREMRDHAKKLAREIETEAEARAMSLGLNPYVDPWDAGYVSRTEARIRRAFGVD